MGSSLFDIRVDEFILENVGPVDLYLVVNVGVEPAGEDLARPHRHRLLAVHRGVKDGLKGRLAVAKNVDGADADKAIHWLQAQGGQSLVWLPEPPDPRGAISKSRWSL